MQNPARHCLWIAASAWLIAGCGGSGTTPNDGGTRDGSARADACPLGALNCTPADGGDGQDAGATDEDTGTTDEMDAGSTDADTDAGTYDAGNNQGTEILPAFDSETDAHVRALVAAGPSHGLSHDVVAKIGDSISESGSYLSDCGFGWYTLGIHPEVEPAIHYYSMRDLGDGRNSLDRASLCAVAGWTAQNAVENGESSALAQELDAIHPQWAVVMYGTNDLEKYDVGTYAMYLNQVVDMIEARGAVTVLSTIPPRTDDPNLAALVPQINSVVRDTAARRHLPLLDYYLALMPLPNTGISSDGVHPSLYVDPTDNLDDGCDFTADAMNFGYNVRNLYTLQMLGRLQSNY